MKETLRKANWMNENGEDLWDTYEISRDEQNVYLRELTRKQGGCDCEVRLPLDCLEGLLSAYDEGEMHYWMNDNAEMLYHADVVWKEEVL